MCFEYEWEYHLKRAEEARKEMQRLEEQKKPKPAAPACVPGKDIQQEDPAYT